MTRFKIVTGGHVDLPGELKDRWGTQFVALEDHDDYIVLRPARDEASMPPEAEEHWPEEEVPPTIRRGSSGAGY